MSIEKNLANKVRPQLGSHQFQVISFYKHANPLGSQKTKITKPNTYIQTISHIKQKAERKDS